MNNARMCAAALSRGLACAVFTVYDTDVQLFKLIMLSAPFKMYVQYCTSTLLFCKNVRVAHIVHSLRYSQLQSADLWELGARVNLCFAIIVMSVTISKLINMLIQL